MIEFCKEDRVHHTLINLTGNLETPSKHRQLVAGHWQHNNKEPRLYRMIIKRSQFVLFPECVSVIRKGNTDRESQARYQPEGRAHRATQRLLPGVIQGFIPD